MKLYLFLFLFMKLSLFLFLFSLLLFLLFATISILYYFTIKLLILKFFLFETITICVPSLCNYIYLYFRLLGRQCSLDDIALWSPHTSSDSNHASCEEDISSLTSSILEGTACSGCLLSSCGKALTC